MIAGEIPYKALGSKSIELEEEDPHPAFAEEREDGADFLADLFNNQHWVLHPPRWTCAGGVPNGRAARWGRIHTPENGNPALLRIRR